MERFHLLGLVQPVGQLGLSPAIGSVGIGIGIGIGVGVGVGVGGFCINLDYEIGHKQAPFEKWLARRILAPTFYSHFTVKHHRDVATPADPASSRIGESI